MKKTLYTITLLLLLGSITSCSKQEDDDDIITNATEGIIGDWKLDKVKANFFLAEDKTQDLSKNNIVYQFRSDGILTVSGNVDPINNYPGHTVRDYTYSIDETQKHGPSGWPRGLKIDDFIYWYRLSQDKLIIDASPLDGATYYLTRID